MKKRENIRILLFFSTLMMLGLFSFPKRSEAARLFYSWPEGEICKGQEIRLDIFIDTEERDINALEGKISLAGEALDLREISEGNSFINFWVETPRIENQEIRFAGIIPGGYSGRKGLLFSIFLRAGASGQGALRLEDARAFANDGLGTELRLNYYEADINIRETPAQGQVSESPTIIDNDAPEKFPILLARDPLIFENLWFLTFATQDKGSGIKYFEVREENSLDGDGGDDWEKADSPYLIKDQDLTSRITIKAVDRAGNETLSVLEAPNQALISHNKAKNDIIKIVLITLALGLIIFIFLLWKKARKKSTK
ncbi:MAG: hypothetical protein WC719_01250 [Patescibacteria group bacterium]|jgi:hypothetical protein